MTLENKQVNFADGYNEPVLFDHESETLIEGKPFQDIDENHVKEEDGPKT